MANEQSITFTETGADGTEKEFEITTAKAEDLTGEDQTFAEAAVEAMFDDSSTDQEASYIDYDGDGKLDTAAADTDGDGQVDTVVADTDGDGEIDAMGLDTDGDGNIDVAAFDTDGDGEIDAIAADTDGDGQIDAVDIDGDGVVDFTLEASEGLPTEQEISTNSVEFTIGEDMFPNADEVTATPEYEAYSAELEAMVEETSVETPADISPEVLATEAPDEVSYSTTTDEASTNKADAEAAALAEQQAHADAARASQEAADEFVEKGDFAAAADAREVAENAAYEAGDNTMLGTSDASDLENAAWKQEIAEDYRNQQQEHIEQGDYAAAKEDAQNAAYASGDADFLAGGPDRTGQSDNDAYNLDWAVHQEENAEYYADNAEKYAVSGDVDNAARYGEQAGVYQASADEFAAKADQESYTYQEDPTSLVETGGTYDPGIAGGYDAGTATSHDAGGYDASIASVDTGIDTSVDTSAASNYDTTSDV